MATPIVDVRKRTLASNKALAQGVDEALARAGSGYKPQGDRERPIDRTPTDRPTGHPVRPTPTKGLYRGPY